MKKSKEPKEELKEKTEKEDEVDPVTENTPTPPEASGPPKWYTEGIVEPFKAGVSRVFILYGDINGLHPNPDADEEKEWPYGRLDDFMWRIFKNRKIAFFYDIASGFRFFKDGMEKEFRSIVDEGGGKADPKDPLAAAKAELKGKRELPSDPNAALPMIEKVLQNKEGVAVIIKAAHLIAPDGGAGTGSASPLMSERVAIQRLKNWGSDRRIKSKGNIIFLVTNQASDVSAELRQTGGSIQSVFIPKPSAEEREAFINSMKNNDDFKDVELADGVGMKQFVVATQGLHLGQMLDIYRRAKQAETLIDIAALKREKIKMLNDEYGEVMEIIQPLRGLDDIGGLDHLKAYIKEILVGVTTGEEALVPMGVLLMGPPGTGKTVFVEATAFEADFNFVKMKNLRSMWVGQSEARGERALKGLRELAPVVVMNDEVDLAEAGRDSFKGDSGVSDRLMKMWMEFLSDPRIRGKVIVVSCTNRPDRVDAALLRSGRNDERILLPMPSDVEREAIFAVMFKRYGIKTSVKDFKKAAKESEGRSGADIEKIVLDSNRARAREGKKLVDEKILLTAIEDAIISANQAEIDRMTIIGVQQCSSRRLLPPHIVEIIHGIMERQLVPGLDDIIAKICAAKIVPVEKIFPKGKKDK